MKKILFILLFVCLIFSNESIALTMKKKGKVTYTPFTDNQAVKKLNISESLFNQDFIQTGKDGFAKFIYLDDGSAIKIHKDSEVYIQGDVDKRKIIKQINVNTGKLKFDVKKQLLSEFTIITPTSVASVKGTRFWIDVNGKKGDIFYGLSGVVEVTNNITGEKVILTQSTTATSLPDGTLEVKKTINKELIKLEILEEDVGEPVNDMPNDDNNNDTGVNNQSLPEDLDNDVNELVIKLINSSSQEKNLIIKYTN